MEDDLIVQETSVESGEVANPQEGLDNPNTEVNTEVTEGETEVTSNPDNTPADDNSGVDTSKAFADRLSKKTKAIEQQFEEKYGKYAKVIEKEAAKYGISAEEYIAEIERQDAEEQAEKERQADIEKYGELPPEILEKVKKADKYEQDQKAQEVYTNEAKAFKEAFPNIKQIPDEVFVIRDTEGCTLLTAYKSYMFEQAQQNQSKLKIEAEQAAIKNLKQNEITPGSLTKNNPDNSPVSFKNMDDKEFEKMIEAVKMGKLKF